MGPGKFSEEYRPEVTFYAPPKYVKLTADVAAAMGMQVAPAFRIILDKYLASPTEPQSTLQRAKKFGSEGRKPIKLLLDLEVVKTLNELCEKWSCNRNQIIVEALEAKAHKLKNEGKLKWGGETDVR
jgi:antitoxin component of RelBE/YafQ-DinJ toxin-antitoxin module